MKFSFGNTRKKRNYVRFSFLREKEYVQSSQIREKATIMAKRLGVVKIMISATLFIGIAFIGYTLFRSLVIPTIALPEAESMVLELDLEEEALEYDEYSGLPVYNNADILIAVDEDNPVSPEIEQDLITAFDIKIDPMIEPALTALIGAAEQDGIILDFSSGFVSWEEQDALYEIKVQELVDLGSSQIMAEALATDAVPLPGNSDTQTGLCVTIDADKDAFPDSEAFLWLSKNMINYGFAFRYPETEKAAAAVTSLGDYRILRYVGTENAIAMRQFGMDFDEYVEYYYDGLGT